MLTCSPGLHYTVMDLLRFQFTSNAQINSLAPGKFEWNFRYLIFQIISVIDGWVISCELALRWMSLDFTDDKSTLVQVMAWCRQATSQYLSQCWPRSLRHMASLGHNVLSCVCIMMSCIGARGVLDLCHKKKKKKNLCHQWFRWWHGVLLVPSHCLNHLWLAHPQYCCDIMYIWIGYVTRCLLFIKSSYPNPFEDQASLDSNCKNLDCMTGCQDGDIPVVTRTHGPFTNTGQVNSLIPGIFQWNLRKIIFKLILVTGGCDISSEIALRWTSQNLNDDKSTLVQVMAWCHQATSHYLNQCWLRSLPPYGVTRPQWVNFSWFNDAI